MLVLGLTACKTRKVAVVVTPPPAPTILSDKKMENLKLLRSKDVSFNTLSVRAKADMDLDGNKHSVSMHIRMERDKQIWVSISAFAGIEVARALITPDSLKVRNNLQGVYLKKPFSYVHRYSNKQVDFKLLQSILTGNTIAEFLNLQAEIKQEDGVWMLNGQNESLAYKILFDSSLKVSENNMNDVQSGQALKVVYKDAHLIVGDVLLPAGLKINSMSGTKRLSIDLEYTRIERNVPLDFPFSVPRKYELIN